nr:MAG TPA: Spc7 kinetochore protein [Caudoviricetes sp.]
MKNWLIKKLGGVSKKDHEEVIQAVNSFYSQRISDGLKEKAEMRAEKAEMRAEKAEMEKAAEMVSENLSETISRLNEANRTIHGLRQIVNGSAISSAEKNKKIEELQAEIEAKNAELARVKSEIIAISKNKADTTLKAENQRLKAELELLKRNKFKRGRK